MFVLLSRDQLVNPAWSVIFLTEFTNQHPFHSLNVVKAMPPQGDPAAEEGGDKTYRNVDGLDIVSAKD